MHVSLRQSISRPRRQELAVRLQRVQGEHEGIRFEPAAWLVAALAVSRLLLRAGKLGKLGIAGLAWTLLPRKLKVAAAGLAVAALVVVMGALAALALLAMQLS